MPDPTSRLSAALAGRYRIERQLGEGGMAFVYLADDLRHARKVAVKVLKPELAAVVGSERFLAEIKTTANLQHPHILPLFDSGEADAFLFYVMPYVEGESLGDRLEREHQLPVEEAVRIAGKVAGALHAAHTRGVIHRDIKPANILLASGEPLVSDFGIALALGAAGAGRLTETGLSLGTPHYMSPEQATGDASVGPATDVYALGCVLYEMLVGEPPFTGSTPQAVLGKIVTSDAEPVSKLRRSVPPHVDDAVRRALEKVPADRFASAHDFAEALSNPSFRHASDQAATGAGGRAATSRRWALAGWSVAAVLAGVTAWALARPGPAAPVSRLELTLPGDLIGPGDLDISRDGSRIVFTARAPSDAEQRLYVRALAEFAVRALPGTEGALEPRFSPDGQSIAYIEEGALRTVTLDGTPPLTVVRDSVFDVKGLTWASDGMIYFGKFATTSGLWRVSPAGGAPDEVAALSGANVRRPHVLPGGRALLVGVPEGIAAVSLTTSESSTILDGRDARYAGGHIVYTSLAPAGTLLVAPFDPEALTVTGPSRTITAGLSVDPTFNSDFAVSESGTLVYRLGQSGPGEGELVWLGRDGARQAVAPELSGVIEAPAISPDGRWIAFDRATGDRRDIWVYDTRDGTTSRATFDGEINVRPEWSTDGSELGFASRRDGVQSFYAIPWPSGGQPRLLRQPLLPGAIIWEALWTADMRELLYRELPRPDVAYLRRAAPHPDSTFHGVVETEFFNVAMSLSPDGRWLAYQSNEAGQTEVYVRAFPGPGAYNVVSRGGGSGPIWSRDGRSLVYVSGDSLIVATVSSDPTFRVAAREPFASTEGLYVANTIQRYDVSSDGQRILAIRDLSAAPSRTVVVQSFFEELEGQLP